MKKSWVKNKTIVISGASSGIGQALAEKFITQDNCYVIGIGRNEEKLKAFKTSLQSLSDHFEYEIFDVSVEENWRNFATKYKSKDIDIVINNAGVLPPFARFDKLIYFQNVDSSINKCEPLLEIIKTNFMSIVYSTTYLSDIIKKSSTPAIINVSSSAGLCALPGISMYTASKAAVKNFTESIAMENDFYVGLVCPGFTQTNIFKYQKHSTDSKLIRLISTRLPHMAKKIYRGIKRRKKKMVYGLDAKFMYRLYRIAPNLSLKIFTRILKKSKMELFDDVF